MSFKEPLFVLPINSVQFLC